jgi:hypothetical protein
MEFRLEDILFVEELPSAITEAGEGIPMIRLWIRKGAHGVILEPFEVDTPLHFACKQHEIHQRFPGTDPSEYFTRKREGTKDAKRQDLSKGESNAK